MAFTVVHIEPVLPALAIERATALPAFHAFTGVDNTGRFSKMGKGIWKQIYLKANPDTIKALITDTVRCQ